MVDKHAVERTAPTETLFGEPMHVAMLRHMRLLKARDRPILIRRVLIAMALAWVPLAVLCLVHTALFRDGEAASFFTDIAAYARFLIAVPALILAEYTTLPRLEFIAKHLAAAELVAMEDRPQLQRILQSSHRLSVSIWPSTSMTVVVYIVIALMFVTASHDASPAWHGRNGLFYLSLAGWWNMLVSLPILLGLVLSWIWRLGVWVRFLFVVSHLTLHLIPAHPDRAAGLQFLAHTPRTFVPVAFAIGAINAGSMANSVLREGLSPLLNPIIPIVTAIVVTLIFMSPPLVFTHVLLHAWHRGILTYGELARKMGTAFEAKWMAPNQVVDRSTLELPDFSSTTDLYGVAANAFNMRSFLFDAKNAGAIAAATLIPFAPLWLSVVPVKVVMKHLVGLFL